MAKKSNSIQDRIETASLRLARLFIRNKNIDSKRVSKLIDDLRQCLVDEYSSIIL